MTLIIISFLLFLFSVAADDSCTSDNNSYELSGEMDSIASNQRQGFAPKNQNATSTYFDQRITIPRDDSNDVSIIM